MTLLKQLKELQQTWKKQNFRFTKQQQEEYDYLLAVRRERVKYFYDNNLVFKGKSTATTTSANN